MIRSAQDQIKGEGATVTRVDCDYNPEVREADGESRQVYLMVQIRSHKDNAWLGEVKVPIPYSFYRLLPRIVDLCGGSFRGVP